jgi:YlmC/YmxH family sporulation protein
LRLSELQEKEIIDISTGKRAGVIIDVSINLDGSIEKLILEERKGSRRLIRTGKDEITINWDKIIKIGDDTILINSNKKT